MPRISNKCLADEDYQGAANAKGIIAALTSAAHGSRPAPGPSAPPAIGVGCAAAMRVEKDNLVEEKRQAQLRHARDELKKRLELQDYSGAATAKAHVITLTEDDPGSHRVAESDDSVAGRRPSAKGSSKGGFSSIENLFARFPQACSPVRLEGVTLLSIGKVSEPPYTDKGKGPGKGQGKGKKGKKGKGRLEAGNQRVQPVYFGDDMGRVICTLAFGDSANRTPLM